VKLYKITTESGKEVVLSGNHRLPTSNGLAEVTQLREGDELFVQEYQRVKVGPWRGKTKADSSYLRNLSERMSERMKGSFGKSMRSKLLKLRETGWKPREKTLVTHVCNFCNEEFQRFKGECKTNKFCSRKCEMAWRKIRYRGEGNPRFGKVPPISFRGGYRIDLDHYVRSSWEANVARLFKYLNICYVYEGKTFYFNHQSYLPDFYLPAYDLYVEVRGFERDGVGARYNLFKEYYPQIHIEKVDSEKYHQLEKEYFKKVPNWEKKK